MFALSPKKQDWLIAVGYIIAIYATLEIARYPLAFLRSHGLLKLTLGTLFFLAAATITWLVASQRPVRIGKILALGVVLLAYYFASGQTTSPEEQVHFFEYGLVGFFLLRALFHDFPAGFKPWFFAFAIGSFAGWLDEILQGLSPHRHYDIRDVVLNAISVLLGLVVTILCKSKNSSINQHVLK